MTDPRSPPMQIAHSREFPSELVVAHHWRDFLSGVSAVVDDQDDMYRLFFYRHGRDREKALLMYFASGRAIWETIRRIALWRFGNLAEVARVLDVGSGHGRVTRFMAADLGRDRVVAAEILPEAREFLRTELGVGVVTSEHDPERFAPEGRFEVVVASSLFTHLPEHRFGAWIERLAGLLSSEGLLLVSTHDLPGGKGFRFEEESESRRLSLAEYGSAWVSETRFREIAGACAPGFEVLRLPRAFANSQDLYLLGRNLGDPAPLLTEADGVECHLEAFLVDVAGRLVTAGWLVDRRRGRKPVGVELRISGESSRSATTDGLSARPDADQLAGETDAARGFRIECPLPASTSMDDRVEITARFEDGATIPLAVGTLSELSLRVLAHRFSDAATRLERAEAEIEWMRSSRFWRLREAWWRIRPRRA